MADRQFAISGKWALAADRLQWMVQRQYLHKGEIKWHSVSFVASTKVILARCLREHQVRQQVHPSATRCPLLLKRMSSIGLSPTQSPSDRVANPHARSPMQVVPETTPRQMAHAEPSPWLSDRS